MRRVIRLAALAAVLPLAARAEPPGGEVRPVVRPVLWWSDLKRVSDGGGGVLPATTAVVTDARAFAREWDRLGLKGPAPRVNFKEYVVVVAFRVSGLEFEARGGLELDPTGNANVVGPPAFVIGTDAGWYSTTIGVFPRRGVTAVGGQKLPAVEEPRPNRGPHPARPGAPVTPSRHGGPGS